ncbi:hypothetical protein ACN6LL_006018, partial [Streptomyces violaceoruber]
MHGASREALAAARERLDALTDSTSVDAGSLADELAAVTALLHREVSLRQVCSRILECARRLSPLPYPAQNWWN